MLAAGKEKARSVLNVYGNIDVLRPYFDVEPHEVRQRYVFIGAHIKCSKPVVVISIYRSDLARNQNFMYFVRLLSSLMPQKPSADVKQVYGL